MDVKYINPFLHGTAEVLMKMSSLMVTADKPYAKTIDIAPGDVSGIIGITGDAVGSLAISFTEPCICSIVTGMLGELHMEINQDVIDAVGELTNMISGAARSRLEKEGMILYAAIPTVVFGKDHTVQHILRSPSIVIPFNTDGGTFYLDVCLKSVKKKAARTSSSPVIQPEPAPTLIKPYKRPSTMSLYSQGLHKSALHQPNTATSAPAVPVQETPSIVESPVEPVQQQAVPKTPEERIEALRKAMDNANAKRREASDALKNNPFMPYYDRKKYNKIIDSCDAAIKRLKLDISAVKMIAEIRSDNVKLKSHYQHYDNSKLKK